MSGRRGEYVAGVVVRPARSCGCPARGRPPPRRAGRPATRPAARPRAGRRGAPPRRGAAGPSDGQAAAGAAQRRLPGLLLAVASSTSRGGAAAGSPGRPRTGRGRCRAPGGDVECAAQAGGLGRPGRRRRRARPPRRAWPARRRRGPRRPRPAGRCPTAAGCGSSSRSASDLAGFMNGSWPGWLRSASASSRSASASRPGSSGVGSSSRAATTGEPHGQRPRQVEPRRHRDARLDQPHPAGPRRGDRAVVPARTSTTSAPRRTARSTPSASSASVASAVCADTTSSGPIQLGHRVGRHDRDRAPGPSSAVSRPAAAPGRAGAPEQHERARTVAAQRRDPGLRGAVRGRADLGARRWPRSAAHRPCPAPPAPADRRAGCRPARRRLNPRGWPPAGSPRRAAAPGCRRRPGSRDRTTCR